MNKVFHFLYFILAMTFSGCVHAEEMRGKIVKIQGHVFILNNKEKRLPETSYFLVSENETVITEAGSKAVIRFNDGTLSVLSEKSMLRIEKTGWLSQLSGKVYYVFKKVFKRQPKKVYTKFATIGIRGTAFIVNVDEDNNMIALQEGGLNIVSPDGDYAIRKNKKASDFSRFKDEHLEKYDAMNKEYSKYKEQLADDFLEYKKSFYLEKNYQVIFNGRDVEQTIITSDLEQEFSDFSSFAESYISKYQEFDDLN